ncbi:MAG: HD domain-containing protein [Desulfobacterales bacterium]
MKNLAVDLNLFPDSMDVYIVGGSLRDHLLNRPCFDYDLVVSRRAEVYADALASKRHGHAIRLGKPDLEIIRVVSEGGIYDISPMNGTSIEEDLRQRDFTLNAMAYCLTTGQIVDPLGGRKDLADGIIRMVSPGIFRDDPVRLIRAFRMSAVLGFDIEPETAAKIEGDAGLVLGAAGERIREELFKIMMTARSHACLSAMADSGLLFEIIPELTKLRGCGQNEHHAHDVFDHSLLAYRYLEEVLNDLDRQLPGSAGPIHQRVNGKQSALLKWAMLLHDIGKPAVRKAAADGRIHFHGHGRKSAEIADKISQRLRFSNRQRHDIDTIIRYHSRPLLLYLSEKKQTLTDRGLTRFFMACGNLTPDVLLHSIGDSRGKGKTEQTDDFVVFAKTALGMYYRDYLPRIQEPALITGHDLIETFGLSPSPLFKEILSGIETERLAGKITSKAAALSAAKRRVEAESDPPNTIDPPDADDRVS